MQCMLRRGGRSAIGGLFSVGRCPSEVQHIGIFVPVTVDAEERGTKLLRCPRRPRLPPLQKWRNGRERGH